MLDYNKKGSYTDTAGVPWIYYQDDVKLNIFYVVPAPTWVMIGGKPEIKLIEYSKDGPTSGSGYVTFNTQLTVPPEINAGVKSRIPVEFPGSGTPDVIPLDYLPGCTAQFTLDVNGTPTDYIGKASEFGSNVATFRADLDKDGMSTIKGLLSSAGGSLDITYNLNVPARLNAVTATLEFDSSIAYKYQVQHAQHHAYAHDTPRIVHKYLTESSASKVHLKFGIQNPPHTLVDSVTSWANDTIASLVSAEVNTALGLLKIENYDSFTINEVSSFHSVYSSDQVVNWKLYPKASLPAVANLDHYTTSVNERTQVMTISCNLPFEGSKVTLTNAPKGAVKEVAVKQVTVQVTYPGLSQKDGNYVFTSNGSQTFKAPYDTTRGDLYDVAWTAEYVDGTQKAVNGLAKDVDNGEYAIELAAVGILSVTFEGRNAFAPLDAGKGATVPPVVTSIDIDFHFADPQGSGTPMHHKQTIQAPPTTTTGVTAGTEPPSTQAVFTSYVAHNVNTDTAYAYTVTYHFKEGPDFVGAETSGNAFNVTIPTPPAPHPVPIIIVAAVANTTSGGGTAPTVIDANVNVWFKSDVTIPGAGPQPTKDDPTSFSLTPTTTNGTIFVRDIFYGFLNGDVPLMYSASIDTMMGTQVNIEATMVENHQPSILVNPGTRYTTITILMGEVDWSSNGNDKITLDINATGTDKGGTALTLGTPHRFLTYAKPPTGTKPHNPPRYVTWAHPVGANIAISWTATYITSGTGTKTATGTASSSNPQIIVPAEGSSALIPVPPAPPTIVVIT